MLQRIKLVRVHYMPDRLDAGILYASDEFSTAAHLCACGCGAKIRTPLGPTDWSLEETPTGPTLHPSIGNWQQKCRSHYWISEGRIIAAPAWTEREINSGRAAELALHKAHYKQRAKRKDGILRKAWHWVRQKLKHRR